MREADCCLCAVSSSSPRNREKTSGKEIGKRHRETRRSACEIESPGSENGMVGRLASAGVRVAADDWGPGPGAWLYHRAGAAHQRELDCPGTAFCSRISPICARTAADSRRLLPSSSHFRAEPGPERPAGEVPGAWQRLWSVLNGR